MSDYTWVTEPPIRGLLTDGEVDQRVTQFRDNIREYGTVVPDSDPRMDAEAKERARLLAERMTKHRDDADTIASYIKGKNRSDDRLVFEYGLAGAPVALMELITRGHHLEIKHIASHPGTEKAGGIMVEFALNKIPEFKLQNTKLAEGIIYLSSDNASSSAAYFALGFLPTGGKKTTLEDVKNMKHPLDMWLDANENATATSKKVKKIWSKGPDNKWRHAAHATAPGYLGKAI